MREGKRRRRKKRGRVREREARISDALRKI
jgi:hypothetical protein